jgi:hypothetical protein
MTICSADVIFAWLYDPLWAGTLSGSPLTHSTFRKDQPLARHEQVWITLDWVHDFKIIETGSLINRTNTNRRDRAAAVKVSAPSLVRPTSDGPSNPLTGDHALLACLLLVVQYALGIYSSDWVKSVSSESMTDRLMTSVSR